MPGCGTFREKGVTRAAIGEPSSRTVMCSLHFTADHYKVGMKPRLLSRSHVEPNNLEKIKVCRATVVFSPAVISSLKFLQKIPKAHERASEFGDWGSTITFMKIVGMWCDLHDISGWKSRQMPFVLSEDDRLTWLEVDFIGYLEDIKRESVKCRAKSLTKETYEATIMTTRSTVAVVVYLLNDVGQVY
ncbi:hypothetical protein MRX96_053880 [Rhipicephalus microplus]